MTSISSIDLEKSEEFGFHCGPTRHEITPGGVAGAELVRRELIVHTTATEIEEEDSANIQSVFAALVDDDRRTAQICADVHAAIGQGRTCLVLTQRTDHIDAIVAGLDTLGDHALVLKGGLGRKARAAVSDAIASRSPDDGIVLVETGSYLGEGFDWPELDSLFLAFPLAFKGRVVQYVGRLLRTHDTKHQVELHDYVDARARSSTACTPNGSPPIAPSASTHPEVQPRARTRAPPRARTALSERAAFPALDVKAIRPTTWPVRWRRRRRSVGSPRGVRCRAGRG